MNKLITIFVISLLFTGFETFAQNKKQKVKVDQEFEQFFNEFKNAVQLKDKDKIASLVNFPFWDYDQTTGMLDKYNENDFFILNKKKYYFAPGFEFLDTKSKYRKALLKNNSINIFKPDYNAFYDELPNLKNKSLIEVLLNKEGYGISSYIFQKIDNSYKLIGEIRVSDDN